MKTLLLKRKWEFVNYVFASCLYIVMDLLFMSIPGVIFDALEKGNSRLFKVRMLYGGAVIVVMALLYIVSRLLRIGYMRNVLLAIRQEAFATIMKMSPKTFGKVSREKYVSRLTNDITLIEEKFFFSLLNFISGLGIYGVGVMIMLVLEPMLALGVIAVSIGCYGVCNLFSKHTQKLQEAVSEGNEALTVNIGNAFNGLEIIKLGNMEQKFLEKNKREISRQEARKCAFNNFTEAQQNILLFAGYLVMVGVIFYLGGRIANGLNLGIAVFLYQLSTHIVFRVMDVVPLINMMQASVKIYAKLTDWQEVQEETGREPFKFEKMIELKQVGLGYEDQLILKDISISFEKGKKYLIKGASGAGKSTFLKMLERIHEEYTGNITIDGVDYGAIDQKAFNERVAMIDQDIFLFEDTIRHNINLYKAIEPTQLEAVVQEAGLANFIAEMPEGLETPLLENGKNLSGGQRQRIAIARALAKQVEILFIDEGTASLNETLGREIEESFLALPHTVIAISHRYYEGVSEQYDYVLELQGGTVKQYPAKSYFEGVSVC